MSSELLSWLFASESPESEVTGHGVEVVALVAHMSESTTSAKCHLHSAYCALHHTRLMWHAQAKLKLQQQVTSASYAINFCKMCDALQVGCSC